MLRGADESGATALLSVTEREAGMLGTSPRAVRNLIARGNSKPGGTATWPRCGS
jgi:hypothetical protein